MSKQRDTSFFIVSSMPRFYQHLLAGVVSYEALGNRILDHIRVAHAFRRMEQVRGLSRILINIPIKEYQLIGQYYLVWCQGREKRFEIESLERIIDQTETYKAQALITRAGFEYLKGNTEAQTYFCTEALKANPTISQRIDIMKTLAVTKATEGYHSHAVRDFENVIPLLKYAQPQVYYDFLNSYAVELGEAGRLHEARNVSQLALASPFAFAYPEWRETAEELSGASRSRLAINQPPISKANLLHLPVVEHGTPEEHKRATRPALVVSLPEWKKKMVNDADSNQGDESVLAELNKLTHNDLKVKIFELACREDMTTENLRDILRYMINKHHSKLQTNPEDK